jgi:hypothetical protein
VSGLRYIYFVLKINFIDLGGLHENGKYENCTGGITGYIDRMIFTNKHLYQHPTCQVVYGKKQKLFLGRINQ